MGLFDLFRKKTTDVTFQKVEDRGAITVANNRNGLIASPSWEQVRVYLDQLRKNDGEFITLTRKEAINGVRYMQACKVSKRYSVQLGLEEGDTTKLVEAYFDSEDLEKIFSDFYTDGTVDHIEKYKPVEFMV